MQDKFYEAWWFLIEHPAFMDKKGIYNFEQSLDIEVAKVNPLTKKVDDDESKNTMVEIWLEAGKWDGKIRCHTHDINLDTGGETFEIAIIRMARLVKKHYGNYEREEK